MKLSTLSGLLRSAPDPYDPQFRSKNYQYYDSASFRLIHILAQCISPINTWRRTTRKKGPGKLFLVDVVEYNKFFRMHPG